MTAVYSFWRNPFGFAGNGYPSVRHFYISLVYSAYNARQFFNKVVIYCNESDVDTFKSLEVFDEVIPCFQDISKLNPIHWAVAKMDVYRRQTQPFWHIDNDVHITKPEIQEFFEKQLVVQSYESWEDFGYNYGPQIEALNKYDIHPEGYVPEWRHICAPEKFSTNAGVFGGTDYKFIAEYANRGVQYMLEHGNQLPDINTTIEQLYFTQLATQAGKPITPLLSTWRPPVATQEARRIGYFHFWGGTKRAVNPKTGRLRLDETAQLLPRQYQIKIAKIV